MSSMFESDCFMSMLGLSASSLPIARMTVVQFLCLNCVFIATLSTCSEVAELMAA